jgi:hypothetical protein
MLPMEIPSSLCDTVRVSNPKIRHVGYYDGFGKILYDSIRPNTKPMEGTEEMHILNGTVALTLNLWKPASSMIGNMKSFVMIREKLIALIAPHNEETYFLVVFEAGTDLSEIDKVRISLEEFQD